MRTLRTMLDGSLEIVIGFSRFLAVAAFLSVFSLLGACAWTGDGRFATLAALAFALAVLSGWFGFWQFGNEEWRRGKAVNGEAEVRHH